MKFIELQKYGDYSVILRLDNNGKQVSLSPFVAAFKPNIRDGEVVDWAQGHYFEDLFNATDFARARGKNIPVQYYRLEEIASKAIDGLVEDDEDSAYEYFANEIEMDSDEAVYFGLNAELLDSYK